MNHQVSDFIIRLKNACLANRKTVDVSLTKVNKSIGKLLVKQGFLNEVKEETVDNRKVLRLSIRYEKRNPVFSGVLVLSKPSLRVYSRAKHLNKIKGNKTDISVLSTSQGIMTAEDAKKKGVGGELLFRIW